MMWDYLVELDVITRILISEKGMVEDSHDGLRRRDSTAKNSFPLLGVMGFSPCTLPTKARISSSL